MEEIVFVTHNKGKAKSAEKYFDNLKISTYDFELDEPRSDDVERENRRKIDGSVESLSVFAEWYKKNKEKDM